MVQQVRTLPRLTRLWPVVAVTVVLAGACGGDDTDDAIPPRITAPTVVPNPDFDPVDDPLVGTASGGTTSGTGSEFAPAMRATLDAIAAEYPTEAAAAGEPALAAAVEEGCGALSAAGGAWEQAAAAVVQTAADRGVPVGFGAYVVGAGATLYCPDNVEVVPFLRAAAEAALTSQG